MRKSLSLALTLILVAALILPTFADGWYCPNCGRYNDSNFCPKDGTGKPSDLESNAKGGGPEYAAAENNMKSNLFSDTFFSFGIYADEFSSITFQSTLNGAPANAWDVSQEGDGAVQAWVKKEGNLYDLTIGANGKIKAPKDCSGLFAFCENVTSIRFNGCLDTSQVENMAGMFKCCYALQELDLSSFDTRNVKAMNSMFYRCEALTKLDVSSFDTSNVTEMGEMFAGCRKLQSLDLRSFDTSSVTYAALMFICCEELRTIKMDVFDMSSMTYWDALFSGCEKLDASNIRFIRNEFMDHDPW